MEQDSQDLPLEPAKVFMHLTQTLASTRSRFEDYSSGVTRLLRLKDDIFSKAATRKPLTSQQLTSLAVISSSLLLRQVSNKAAVEEQLKGVDAEAKQSLEQAKALPTRALLLWGQLAIKLLRRVYISEHLQTRYRTARMLEIWDLAAASLPPAVEETPRQVRARRARAKLLGAEGLNLAPDNELSTPAALKGQDTAADPSQAYSITAGAAALPASTQPASSIPSASSRPAALRAAADTADLSRSSSQRQRQASPVSAAAASTALAGPYSRAASGQVRDAPLLQVSPAQLSRSSSQTTGSNRAMANDMPANAGVSDLAAEPTLADFASSRTGYGPTHSKQPPAPSEEGLLAVVNTAVGDLGFAGVPSGAVAGTPADTVLGSHEMQDVVGLAELAQDHLGTSAAAAPVGDMFFSMPLAVPARTRSSFRTGSLLGGSFAGSQAQDAGGLSSLAIGIQLDAMSGGNNPAATVLPHQLSNLEAGLPTGLASNTGTAPGVN